MRLVAEPLPKEVTVKRKIAAPDYRALTRSEFAELFKSRLEELTRQEARLRQMASGGYEVATVRVREHSVRAYRVGAYYRTIVRRERRR